MRQKHIIFAVVCIFLTWNMLMYYTLVNKSPSKSADQKDIKIKLNDLQQEIETQLEENEKILRDLRKLKDEAEKDALTAVTQLPSKGMRPNKTGTGGQGQHQVDSTSDDVVLPILMIACDRKDAVIRSLDLVLKYRPDKRRFPIIVSQDCGHKETADTIQTYVKEHGIKHIMQPDLSKITLPWPQRKFEGYYKISRHYKWALGQVFQVLNSSAVIIIEDDLDISPDFFHYFAATYRVLAADPSLWCVSAWNDNGKRGMVKDDPELLHRTDFFPGLGWMLEKKLWDEIGPKWPDTFWDDWMRHQNQRQERTCIRPEISRTSTFGKKGVSKGLFFEKHLKFIQLNDKAVPFTERDLSYLIRENYDPVFIDKIYGTPEVKLDEIIGQRRKDLPEVRINYGDKNTFKLIAKKLGIMDDFKAGVPRAAYRGVVSFMYQGQRVHVAPPRSWNGYDVTWS